MRKEELIQQLTDINSNFVNDINTELTDLSEKINRLTTSIANSWPTLSWPADLLQLNQSYEYMLEHAILVHQSLKMLFIKQPCMLSINPFTF